MKQMCNLSVYRVNLDKVTGFCHIIVILIARNQIQWCPLSIRQTTTSNTENYHQHTSTSVRNEHCRAKYVRGAKVICLAQFSHNEN